MVVEASEDGEVGGKFMVHFTDAERFDLASLVKKGAKIPVKGRGLCCIYVSDMEKHTGYQGYIFPGHLELLNAPAQESTEDKEGKKSKKAKADQVKEAEKTEETEGSQNTGDSEEP